ncbi:MAG: TonB-dependent receptor [Myxococcaceae bacterium]
MSPVRGRGYAVALVLLIGATSFADNTADEADVAFTLGNNAYAKRNYEEALSQYFLSNRLVPNVNVVFNIARCYEALKQFDEAYRYYHDLSLQTLPDEDKKEVTQALARLSGKVALIEVSSEPPGADIYIDREDLGSRGKTPQTVALQPGSHLVRVKLGGYHQAEEKVSLSKGRAAKTKLSLSRVVGTVELNGEPAGAHVRESPDGADLGVLPFKQAYPPGQKLFHVVMPGFTPQQLLLDVKADASVAATVTLQPLPKPTGKVVVVANRDNAVVKVDGKESGFTPTVLTLVEGEHRLEISAPELRPFEQTVQVSRDSEQKIVAELRYAPPKVAAASKSLQSIDEAPASITVITREEIESFGYQSLAEALQAVRGFFLSDDRIYQYIGVRGFSPAGDLNTRIAVLWDGHPMNDVWAGQGYSARDFTVDLADVDHIEIVRGPASALYGTGAVFGVINVVTRKSLGDQHVEAIGGAGGENGVKGRLLGGLGNDKAGAVASVAGFNSTGAVETPLPDYGGTAHGNDQERALGASASARAGDFSLVAHINQRRKYVPTVPLGASFDVAGTNYLDARGFTELRFEHAFDRLTVSARAYYDASRFNGAYAVENPDDTIRVEHAYGGADWGGGEVRGRLRVFGENFLSVGFEGQYQSVYQQVGQPNVDAHLDHRSRVLLSGSLLDEWKIHPRLFVQLGIRVDKYLDLSALPFSPRLGIVAKPYDGGLSKLVVGQAFRAPNVYELYYTDGQTQTFPTTLGPEQITTFELEHSHDLTQELRLTGAAYYNLIDRLVVLGYQDMPASMPQGCSDATGAMSPCLVFGNSTQRISALGAEFEARWQPGRYTLVDVGYSFVYLTSSASKSDSQARADFADATRATPRHLVFARAMVPIVGQELRLSGQVTYQSARGTFVHDPSAPANLGEALLINVGLAGQYGHVRYFAGVRNLLDDHYFLPVGADTGQINVPQYGRTFFIELAAGF